MHRYFPKPPLRHTAAEKYPLISAVSSRLTLRQNFVFCPDIRTHDILSPSHTLGLTAFRIAFSPRKVTCPVRQYPYTRRFFPSYLTPELRLLPRHPDSWHFEAAHTLGLMALRVVFSPRKVTCPARPYPYTRIMSAAALGFFPCVSPYSVRPRLFSLSQKKPPVFQRTADLFLSLPFYPLLSSNILAIALTTMSISVFEVFAHIS